MMIGVEMRAEEAYRAAYTPLLNEQSEATWTFGQIFPVKLLLLPIVELIRNGKSPVEDGGISKFRAWVSRRDNTPLVVRRCCQNDIPVRTRASQCLAPLIGWTDARSPKNICGRFTTQCLANEVISLGRRFSVETSFGRSPIWQYLQWIGCLDGVTEFTVRKVRSLVSVNKSLTLFRASRTCLSW
jgi:hypothetical protein